MTVVALATTLERALLRKSERPSSRRRLAPHRPGRVQAMSSLDNDTGHTHARLRLTPLRYSKVIHFIRHAEGFHNLGMEDQQDAHLTAFGWRQAEALREHIIGLIPSLNLQLVVASPMVRTLETASGVFGGGPAEPGMPLLMAKQQEEPSRVTAHGPVAVTPNLPFVACELCRERMSSADCDRRQPSEGTATQFPGFDFSEVRDVVDSDEMWMLANEGGGTQEALWNGGEDSDSATKRAASFLRWLMRRPESRIAVVAHADILTFMMSAFGSDFPVAAQNTMHRVFAYCEMRSMLLTDIDSSPGQEDTHFPGGRNMPQKAA